MIFSCRFGRRRRCHRPVAEPYVQAFPLPEAFFDYLSDGYYTLAEAYFLSLPYLSWRMVLVGDPLYWPFKTR